jgi:aminoglycoside 3-N-acetyltransferase I
MIVVRRLGPGDAGEAAALNALFADAFEDGAHYLGARPSRDWLEARLTDPSMLVLVAGLGGRIVGGLTAYVLPKLEKAQPELFLYDIAVERGARRRGVASALLARAGAIAADLGAMGFFVLAHAEDAEAIAFYRRHAIGETVLSFDLPMQDRPEDAR